MQPIRTVRKKICSFGRMPHFSHRTIPHSLSLSLNTYNAACRSLQRIYGKIFSHPHAICVYLISICKYVHNVYRNTTKNIIILINITIIITFRGCEREGTIVALFNLLSFSASLLSVIFFSHCTASLCSHFRTVIIHLYNIKYQIYRRSQCAASQIHKRDSETREERGRQKMPQNTFHLLLILILYYSPCALACKNACI